MQTYLLIAQNCDGYEPIAEVTLEEASQFARDDMAMRSPEADDFCPEEYALWERTPTGCYTIAQIIRL